jgi:acyl-CoA reductase-like NAD-dependent aldehyde dehydrogenase
LQVRDNKTALANYETQDMGKPIDEAEWDMVSGQQQLG